MTDKNKTVVIFRKDINYINSIVAIFPQMQYNDDITLCCCYSHVGQHSSCCYGYYYNNTVPATKKEYMPLYKELISIGYNLKVKQRITKRWY